MGAMSHQLGFAAESVFGTVETPTRFFEFESEGIEETEGRTEGEHLRPGSGYQRSDRHTPYFKGAAGPLVLPVMTKGFGFFLPHLMGGTVGTTGPAETTVYSHTVAEGDLYGNSFTCQLNRPFHPSGTDQAFTYSGGKIPEWELANAVDGNLMLTLTTDFAAVDTDTEPMAAVSYPTGMDNFTWAGGVVSIGGVDYDVDEFALKVNNGLNVERRKIRANTMKKEPTAGRRSATFSIKADFESMTQRARAHATTKAGNLAAITGTWEGPAIVTGATTLKPQLKVTMTACRFDAWKGAVDGPNAIGQELSGVVRYDGTNSPLTILVKSSDATP